MYTFLYSKKIYCVSTHQYNQTTLENYKYCKLSMKKYCNLLTHYMLCWKLYNRHITIKKQCNNSDIVFIPFSTFSHYSFVHWMHFFTLYWLLHNLTRYSSGYDMAFGSGNRKILWVNKRIVLIKARCSTDAHHPHTPRNSERRTNNDPILPINPWQKMCLGTCALLYYTGMYIKAFLILKFTTG